MDYVRRHRLIGRPRTHWRPQQTIAGTIGLRRLNRPEPLQNSILMPGAPRHHPGISGNQQNPLARRFNLRRTLNHVANCRIIQRFRLTEIPRIFLPQAHCKPRAPRHRCITRRAKRGELPTGFRDFRNAHCDAESNSVAVVYLSFAERCASSPITGKTYASSWLAFTIMKMETAMIIPESS